MYASFQYSAIKSERESIQAFSSDLCIHHLFEIQQKRSADIIAVISGEEHLSYYELNARANQVACYLQRNGIGLESRVGVCMKRSPLLIVSLLAILKAGGAYVPLDPAYPKERLSFIIQDSQVNLLIIQQDISECLPTSHIDSILLDALDVLQDETKNVTSRVKSNNLAYSIYTSGSTGKPKGVMIEHRNAVALLQWAGNYFTPTQLAGVLASTSLCFDLSIFEIFVPLSYGGTVILAENILHIFELPAFQAVTLINTVPSAIASLLPLEKMPPFLHTVNLAGEPLSQSLAQQVYELTNAQQVVNLYGPSESTTYSTCSLIARDNSQPPSIGFPIAGTHIYLLNTDLQYVSEDEIGEIYIAGAGLARGYHGCPDLTAEKFIPDPFNSASGARLYKTGDLARYRSNGSIEFVGRADSQIKIRGFRIELGEIETHILMHQAVQAAIVIAREDTPGDRQLVAYLVPHRQTTALPHSQFNTQVQMFLKERLPGYMIPSHFVVIESLPLTLTGKVDRQALPVPSPALPSENTTVSPCTPVEEMLTKIWGEVLKNAYVGTHTSFFELGGHSLQIIQIVSRIRETFGIDLSLSTLFEYPTITLLAPIIETILLNKQRERGLSLPIILIPRNGDLPLSFSQERVWFLQQLNPANTAYTFQATLRLRGKLDRVALERGLNEILQRHEILRTTFPSEEGRPAQIIHPFQQVTLPLHDLRSLLSWQREKQAQYLIDEEIQKPFDLTCLPLLRWLLLQLDEEDYLLLHREHHIIHDGWSFNVFLQELMAIYPAFLDDQPSPLSALSFQFVDFAAWQRAWLQQDEAKRQEEYWKRTLVGSPPILHIPSDRPRPAIQSPQGAVCRIDLSPEMSGALKDLSRQENVTLFMVMFAAFLLLLHRYTGQNDLCVASGVANRRQPEVEKLIGMIVNTVILRTNMQDIHTFHDLVQRVRTVSLEAYANEDLPFGKVVEILQPKRSLSYSPLYQVMFSFHDSPLPVLSLPGAAIELTEALSNRSAKCDLDIVVIPRAEQQINQNGNVPSGKTTMIWEYSTDLFHEATIRRMIGHYQILLETVIADPMKRLSELSLLTDTEMRQMFHTWNTGERKPLPGLTLANLFEIQVERTPESLAVIYHDKRITYRELNERANQVAHYLQRLGVRPEVRVGIFMERSLELFIGLLGILKAGGAYVPFDPMYPQERLSFILKDAQVTVLLTQESSTLTFPEHTATVVCMNRDVVRIKKEATTNPINEADAANLAYILFTSGSTGTPKGVLMTHTALVNLCFALKDRYAIQSQDRILQFASIGFDVLAEEFFLPLLNGASVYIPPAYAPATLNTFFSFLAKHALTVLNLPASYWHECVSALSRSEIQLPQSLRLVIVGSEKVSLEQIFTWNKWVGERVTLIHAYGLTEAAVTTTTYELPVGQDSQVLPIGRPLSNTQVYVLDAHFSPVPVGVPGELYIGGEGLARGYLNRSELTAERFLPHPYSSTPGTRLYRTGDQARYLEDGNLELLGRLDHQIKIRGFRIELGEIEAVLCQHPAIQEAIVIQQEHFSDRRLVAYLVPSEAGIPSSDTLNAYLKEILPPYMIPASFVSLPAFPRSPHGKVDKGALLFIDNTRQDIEITFLAPRNAFEEHIAQIWSELLGQERIGINENFFELGGHSLLATRVISRLYRAFHIELSLITFFEDPTVAGLAAVLEKGSKVEKEQDTIIRSDVNQGEARKLLTQLEHLSDAEKDALLDELLRTEELPDEQ